MPTLSVIIPHRDDAEGLGNSLAALARQDVRPPWRMECIVVDNVPAHPAAAAQVLAALVSPHAVRLVTEATPGAAPARNAGFAAASGEYIAFLDCDCVPGVDWATHVIRALDHAAIAGGPVVVRLPEAVLPQTPAVAFDLLFGFNSRLSFSRDGLLLTANLAVRRAVFADVGPFRTMVSEDRDWCMRAAARGYTLVLDDRLSVAHAPLGSERQLRARWRRITRESFCFHRAYGGGGGGWLFYMAKVAISPFLHGWRIFSDPRMARAPLSLRLRTLRLLFSIRWQRVRAGVLSWVENRHGSRHSSAPLVEERL